MAKKQHKQKAVNNKKSNQQNPPEPSTDDSDVALASSQAASCNETPATGDLLVVTQAFELSPVPMCIARMDDGKIIKSNRAALNFFAMTEATLANSDADTALSYYADPEDRKRLLQQLKDSGGKVNNFETILVTRNGQRINTQVSSSIFDQHGCKYVFSLFNDITAEKVETDRILTESSSIKLLNTITSSANQADSIEMALQFALDEICKFCDWPLAHIWIADEKKEKLYSSKIWHCTQQESLIDLISLTEKTVYPFGWGPGELTAQQTTHIDHVDDIPKSSPRINLYKTLGIIQYVSAPIMAGSRTVAVMEFMLDKKNKKQEVAFNLLPQIGIQIGRVFERQQAEAIIREKDNFFHHLIDNLNILVWKADNDYQFTYVSKSAERILGYPAEKWYEKDFLINHLHPDDKGNLLFEIDTLSQSDENSTLTYRMLAANGDYVWLQDIVLPGIDEEDQSSGVTFDITQLKMAELALEESQQRYKELIDDAHAIVWEMDYKKRTFTFVSKSAKNILGYDIEAWLEPGFWDRHLHREDKRLMSQNCPIKNDCEGVIEQDFRLIAANGSIKWLHDIARVTKKDAVGNPLILRGIMHDITETRRLSDEISYQATHDSLTDLANRQEFEHQLQSLLDKNDQDEHALCFLDLDQFKIVNDTCGHLAGDELLKQLSVQLKDQVRQTDTIARLGGDEFGVILKKCSLDRALDVAEKLRDLVSNFKFVWDNKHFNLGVSIGLTAINNANRDLRDLLSTVDAACYAAKDAGRNQVYLSHITDDTLSERRGEMNWVTRLNHAIEDGRLLLYRQPILNLADPEHKADQQGHYELLLRMIDENGQIIPPGAFLPAAERYNLATKVDKWVIGKVFEWLTENQQQLDSLTQLNINLSGQSISNPAFIQSLSTQLENCVIPTSKICFEITETAAIHNLSVTVAFLDELKEKGCKFALDDFGSGLSSFSYLKNLPVDYLKIDGAFVKNMANDEIDAAMVRSINDIGHVMGKKTVAEFVQDTDTVEKLREMGVDYAQGYHIGEPEPFISSTAMEHLLRKVV